MTVIELNLSTYLSTGLGEILEHHKSGQVRVLVITADERSSAAEDIPTLKELGYDVSFVNWRGFFGPPGLPEDNVSMYAEVLKNV